jgi:hypothetical protein
MPEDAAVLTAEYEVNFLAPASRFVPQAAALPALERGAAGHPSAALRSRLGVDLVSPTRLPCWNGERADGRWILGG